MSLNASLHHSHILKIVYWSNNTRKQSICLEKSSSKLNRNIFTSVYHSDKNIALQKSMAEMSLNLVGLCLNLRASLFSDFTYSFTTLKWYIKKYKHLVILRCRPGEQTIWQLKNIMTTTDLLQKYEFLDWYFHFTKTNRLRVFSLKSILFLYNTTDGSGIHPTHH